ncbi:hypothetical protein JDV02_000731 [Purpureocillium takamizusanense]|uniref:DUF1740-domain-containing protein n=1 Tax=Purpureocillium takamizusanense TaxID=2060973 RepID=A0A9Q8Q7N3_9HYPO|nr:uncharacterized protein JDV02_000731 [Purpureocillium takamizusanense]UNI14054.1 hypothetical protein JDV02_000731 [Purpureocillium takamizusanense]
MAVGDDDGDRGGDKLLSVPKFASFKSRGQGEKSSAKERERRGDDDDAKKPVVPRFSSFKPKAGAPEQQGENLATKKRELRDDGNREASVPTFGSFKPKTSSGEDSGKPSTRGRDRRRDDSRSEKQDRHKSRSERRQRDRSRSSRRHPDGSRSERRRRDSSRSRSEKRHQDDSRSGRRHRDHSRSERHHRDDSRSRSEKRHRDSSRSEKHRRDDSRSERHRRHRSRSPSETQHREGAHSKRNQQGDSRSSRHHRSRSRSRSRSEKHRRHESHSEGHRRDDSHSEQRHRHHRSKRRRESSSGGDGSSNLQSRKLPRNEEERPPESNKSEKPPEQASISDGSGLFVFDTKGDPLLLKYGPDPSKVPAFRRYGGGRVLGTDGRLVLHLDGSFSLVFPGDRTRSRPTKHGLRTGLQTRTSVRMRPNKGGVAGEEPGDYIALDGSQKHKDQSDSEDSSDDEQPVWRSIEGKAVSGQIVKSDPDGDEGESSDEDFDDTTDDNPLKWKSILLNRQVKEHPEDIDSWMELVDHQDDLMQAGETTDERTSDDTAHSFAEIKLGMLESALSHAADGKDRGRVLAALMHEGSKIWTSSTAAKKWRDVSEKELESFPLWKTHLDFAMSDIGSLQYDKVKKLLLDRLHILVARSGLYAPQDILEAIYVFLRATRFIHDSGYRELAIAAWQALLELNYFRPNERQGQAEALEAFEEFWESEVPRIGEAQSLGWKHFVESGGESPEAAKAPDGMGLNPSMNAYAWGVFERLQERQARMPARTLDGGTDNDPFRIVMFSDLRPLLFQIPVSFLSEVYQELVDAFLLFCGLPPAFDSSSWTALAQDDQYLAAAGANIETQPAWESKQNEDGDELQRKPPRFFSGLPRAKMSSELLFGGASWFQHLDRARHDEGNIDMSWVQNALEQLAHLEISPKLALYYLGVCFARDPETIRKPAKALLKRYPCETELYNAYALAEYANDDQDVAIKVLSSASMSKHVW